jgi:hypothetical protein
LHRLGVFEGCDGYLRRRDELREFLCRVICFVLRVYEGRGKGLEGKKDLYDGACVFSDTPGCRVLKIQCSLKRRYLSLSFSSLCVFQPFLLPVVMRTAR